MVSPLDTVARPKISVCALVQSEVVRDALAQALSADLYTTVFFQDLDAFLIAVEAESSTIDCLVFEQVSPINPPAETDSKLVQVISRLHQSAILLPAIFLTPKNAHPKPASKSFDGLRDGGLGEPEEEELLTLEHEPRANIYYHTAEERVGIETLPNLPQAIDAAITQFLKLSPQCRIPSADNAEVSLEVLPESFPAKLYAQQQRLSEKLKERLGYLGIFYKRDPQLFFRNLPKSEREDFLKELQADYRDIILDYFQEGSDVNQQIDAFVNKVFFADLSVSQVLEIHMEFMDLLAKKLKLEGRNEDILLDYRLTLIDTIAHLCEMYRRSIPRKPQNDSQNRAFPLR